jgi:hypothetical protein
MNSTRLKLKRLNSTNPTIDIKIATLNPRPLSSMDKLCASKALEEGKPNPKPKPANILTIMRMVSARVTTSNIGVITPEIIEKYKIFFWSYLSLIVPPRSIEITNAKWNAIAITRLETRKELNI